MLAPSQGILNSANLPGSLRFTYSEPCCHGNKNLEILSQTSYSSACNRYVADSCTRPGILGVGKFNGIIYIYPRPTFVAMVTKIWEFLHKISYNFACIRVMCYTIAPNGDFEVGQFPV